MATDQKYLSKQKAARRLDCSTKTIDRCAPRASFDWIKVGSGVRILIASLEGYEQRSAGERSYPGLGSAPTTTRCRNFFSPCTYAPACEVAIRPRAAAQLTPVTWMFVACAVGLV